MDLGAWLAASEFLSQLRELLSPLQGVSPITALSSILGTSRALETRPTHRLVEKTVWRGIGLLYSVMTAKLGEHQSKHPSLRG